MTEQPRAGWQRFMPDRFRAVLRPDYAGKVELVEKKEERIEVAPYRPVFSGEVAFDDADLVRRIARFFRTVSGEHTNPESSFWKWIVDQHKGEVSAALLNGDLSEAGRLLRDPSNTMFHYGFEHLVSEFRAALNRGGDTAMTQQGANFHSRLLFLAEAIGAIRLADLENTPRLRHETDMLVDRVEDVLGFEISFPNPFPNEFGVATKRGVASYRAINSLYQAYLLRTYADGIPAPSVLDIGSGLGRTAYYAHRFGFRNYTLIDLPTSCVAQANFLGRTLGEDRISLQGEEAAADIKIRIPEWLPEAPPVDIVMNVDSLTEMSRESADTYVAWAKKNAKLLISINHEHNKFTAREVMLAAGLKPSRERYWLRDGYVIEVAEI